MISFDGKEFKGSGRSINSSNYQRNKNVLNVYNTSKELCIYSNPLDDKESEIKEAQTILNKYNLKNVIVTADALHCQKKTCWIIKEKKGDYIFTVKENQPGLLKEIQTKFNKINSAKNISFNDCEYSILILPSSYVGLDFKGQKTYIKMISNKRKNQSMNKQIERYFISFLKILNW